MAGRRISARGVYGFWPANADGDDLVLEAGARGVRFHMLRQQSDHGDGRPNRSLADYVAPAETGLADHVGAFAVTAGIGVDEVVAGFEADNDDYRAIMVKALADRLAEAFAEHLHEVARRAWYETGPTMTNEELIAERYRGIRPAFGYPSCPDHSENCAMLPAASVSGLYFGHPAARYFNVGRIGRDQVEDCARRKGVEVAEAERWLRPNLAYDPD